MLKMWNAHAVLQHITFDKGLQVHICALFDYTLSVPIPSSVSATGRLCFEIVTFHLYLCYHCNNFVFDKMTPENYGFVHSRVVLAAE